MNPTILSTIGLIAAESAKTPQPEHWVGNALLGAALAVAGYAGRALHENLKARWNAQKSSRARLQKLSTLLAESNSLFHDQNFKARELLKMLQQRLGKQVPDNLGFDETFYRLYSDLLPDERHVHSLIRSTTMNSLRRVNTDTSEWLRSNSDLRQIDPRKPLLADLAAQLSLLERHLNQWHDKFHVFMQDDKHCLVYLADERKDGTGFPKQLEPILAKVLKSEL